MPTTEAEQVIDRYVATWDRGDVDELLDYFTESAVWHPMPMRPAVAKPAIRALVSEWLRTAPRGEVHRQVSDGKTVMHERTVRSAPRFRAPNARTERAHRTTPDEPRPPRHIGTVRTGRDAVHRVLGALMGGAMLVADSDLTRSRSES